MDTVFLDEHSDVLGLRISLGPIRKQVAHSDWELGQGLGETLG